jgi:hypothetical protein
VLSDKNQQYVTFPERLGNDILTGSNKAIAAAIARDLKSQAMVGSGSPQLSIGIARKSS